MSSTLQLRGDDAYGLLAFAGEVAGCRDAAQMNAQFADLPRLIGADSVIVMSCRDWMGEMALEVSDPNTFRPELIDAVGSTWRDHPYLSGDLARATRGARKITDFVRPREWRRRALFNDFYRPLGMARELALQLAWGPVGSSCCVVLYRAGSDFSERDRAALELLAPHLRSTRARIAAETLAAQRLALLDCGLEASGRAALPTEHDDALSPTRLTRLLPITSREAEVLGRLASGRTNAGIAHDLSISRHTVVRHVESIYAKIDVHTRVEATRMALDAPRSGVVNVRW
jgi:DNA-binding CsgD family transcriptional regulator